MALPDCAAPLIADLLAFSDREELDEARESALVQFVSETFTAEGENVERADPSTPEFRDFFAFDFPLEPGESADDEFVLDLYIEAIESSADEATIAVLRRFAATEFGYFLVVDAAPGELVVLEQPGRDQTFRVPHESIGTEIHEGQGLLGRIVPFADHHEFSYPPARLDRVNTYRASRWVYRDHTLALAELGDPVAANEILRGWIDHPPVLADSGGALAAFSPALDEDMRFEVGDAVDPDKFTDQESINAAVQEVQYEWFDTPQEALDDKSPNEVIRERAQTIFDVPTTDAPDYPEPNLPAWEEDDLARLCENENLPTRVAAWSVRMSRGESPPDGIVRELFEKASYTHLEDTISLWTESLPNDVATAVSAEIRSFYSDIPAVEEDERGHELSRRATALDFVTERDLVESFAQISAGLSSESELERHFAVDALQEFAFAADASDALPGLWEELSNGAISSAQEESDRTSELLASLLTLAPAAVFARALAGVLEVLDGDLHLLDSLAYHLEYCGVPPAYVTDIEDAVDTSQRTEDHETVWTQFEPTADAAAARRSDEIITPAFRREIENLAQRGAYRKMVPLLCDANRRAYDSCSGESTSLSPLASQIDVVFDLLASEPFLSSTDREGQSLIATLLATLLSKFIRGRWPRCEAREILANEDLDGLKALFLVNESWLTNATIDRCAELLDVDDLTEAMNSDDEFVRENALLVLARRSPEAFLTSALEEADSVHAEYPSLLRHVIRSSGEAALHSALEYLRSNPADEIREYFFLFTALVSGTERARRLVEVFSDYFCRSGASGSQLVAACLAIRSKSLAHKIVSAIEDGRILLASPKLLEHQRDRAIADLEALVDVFDIDEDPQSLFARNVEEYERQIEAQRSAPLGEGFDEEWDEAEEELPGLDYEHSHGHSHEHGPHCNHDHSHDHSHGFSVIEGRQAAGSTFRHETPQAGRNDPCPCGSGKKFKKCCGK